MKKTLLILCLSVLCFTTVHGSDLEIQTLDDITWRDTVGYNPFEGSIKYHRVPITIKNTTNTNLDFAITISKGNENNPDYLRKASSALEVLNYQIYTQNNRNRKYIGKELNDIEDVENLITQTAKKNKTKTVYAYIYVDEEQIVNTDTYNDTLTFKLYSWDEDDDVDDATFSLMEERTVQLNIPVQKFILADFTDNSGNFLHIDFDELEEGKTETFDLRVQSNSGYQLLAYSLNKQVLKLNNSSLNKAPYSFVFENTEIDLTGNTETLLVQKKKKTSKKGTVYNSEISINALPPLTAGTYEDKITIILREL